MKKNVEEKMMKKRCGKRMKEKQLRNVERKKKEI